MTARIDKVTNDFIRDIDGTHEPDIKTAYESIPGNYKMALERLTNNPYDLAVIILLIESVQGLALSVGKERGYQLGLIQGAVNERRITRELNNQTQKG